jgi:hypothetical protein
MNVQEFCEALKNHPNHQMNWKFPDDSVVPAHYHVTEVGRVVKTFVDCGGTVRSDERCVLQIWVAHDTDHRLSSDKLLKIMNLSCDIVDPTLPVEVEYQKNDTVSLYRLDGYDVMFGTLVFRLQSKNTVCLAPDRCGVSCC